LAKPAKKKDLLWGYFAQTLNIGAGLILLPIILRYFTVADVGLWFVFITLAGFAQLLEFGFLPTLTRNVAYVYAGADSLLKEGVPESGNRIQPVNQQLLGSLILSARRIYRVVALLAAVVMFVGGSGYIYTTLSPAQDFSEIVLAWLVFAFGYVLTFYFGYYNGLLQGRGDVTLANKVVVITKTTLIVAGCISTVAGWGLLGLGVASALSAAVGRVVARYYFNLDNLSVVAAELKSCVEYGPVLGTLWYNASRLGAVQVGGFLIQRGNILLASSFLGLEAAASYGMTITVVSALAGVAGVAAQVQIPHLCALEAKGDRESCAAVYGEALILGGLVFLFGLLALMVFGNYFLELIGSQTMLLPTPLLCALGLIWLLEMNHVIAATYLTTLNFIPFVPAALLSGIAVFVTTLLLINPLGVLGLIIGQGLPQLAYNNWKWPVEAMRNLSTNLMSVIKLGARKLMTEFSDRN
jgi:O-antigen/teichoic acid export membrane protein